MSKNARRGGWQRERMHSMSVHNQETEISFVLRASGKKDDIETLHALMRGSEHMDPTEPRTLAEVGNTALVQFSSGCYDHPTLVDGMKTLRDGLDFAGIAGYLSLNIEVFSTGVCFDGEYCHDFCEHLHANADGMLLACEMEDVDDILDWDPCCDSIEELKESYGYGPDEDVEDWVFIPSDFTLIVGCPIAFYEWGEDLTCEHYETDRLIDAIRQRRSSAS
jgi:hypothetical protein